MKDFSKSQIERQNILNNNIALAKIEKQITVSGYEFDGIKYFTNAQLAEFFDVDMRTIERIIENNKEELTNNGYRVLSGKELSVFKEKAKSFGTDTNVGTKTTVLSVSTFRTLLNFSMLLTNNKIAKETRSMVLDAVINLLAEKTGGNTKLINQRDKDYLSQAFREETERQKFTNAVDTYVSGGKFKYAVLTNKIYEAIFKENAKEYREILKLDNKHKTRETMYSEVLLLIASFEAGLAYEINKLSTTKERKLSINEVKELISSFSSHPLQQPLLHNARTKMASRDLGFRDSLHISLQDYLEPVSKEDFEKFLGEQSKSLEEQISAHKDVFNRLRDK